MIGETFGVANCRGPTAGNLCPSKKWEQQVNTSENLIKTIAKQVAAELKQSSDVMEDEPMIDVKEVAAFLYGAYTKKNRRRIYTACANNHLPYHKIGNRYFFYKSELRRNFKNQQARNFKRPEQ